MSIISKNIENLKPNKEYIVTVRAKNNDINVLSGYTDSIRFRTPTDSTIPEAPTGLVLAASFLNVLFKYTDSVDEDTAKYEYELYKDDQIEVVGGLNSIISGEIPHRTGFVQTNVFLVSVDDNSTTTSTSSVTNPVKYYGRVRSIDSAGNIGGWTSIVASGDTPLIDEEFIGSLTAAKITAGTIGAHEIILTQPGTATTITSPDNKAILRSSDYNGSYNNITDIWTSGTAGWIISGDGRAEFNNITARGAIDGGTIDIGGSDTTSFHVDSSGNMWLGAANSGTAPFKVTSGGALTATGVNVTGQINASSGTFSGSITASGTISGGTISGATITGGTVQTAASGQRIVLSGTTFNLYAAGSGDTSTIVFNPAATTNYGLMTSTGGIKISAQGATLSIGYANTDLGPTGVKLEEGAYFQVLNGSIDIRRNTTTTDWRTANLILRANLGNNNAAIAFKANETNDNATAQIRVGGGANYFFFRNYNDTANVRIIAADGLFAGTTNASDVNSANLLIDSTAANVSLGFKASTGTYSAQIRMGGSNELYFTQGLNSNALNTINVDKVVYVSGTLGTSSVRYKENIENIFNIENTDAIDTLKLINISKFNFKSQPALLKYGVIAEELEKVFPEAIHYNDENMVEAVFTDMLNMLQLAGIRQLINKIEKLEEKINLI
jgi:hypothetical protein